MIKENSINQTTLEIIKLFDIYFHITDEIKKQLYDKINNLDSKECNKVVSLLRQLGRENIENNKKLELNIKIITNNLEELEEKRSLT